MKLKRKIKYFIKYILIHPRRLVNLLKIKISKRLKKIKISGFPPTLMIEPTNTCNLKCPLCPTGAGFIKRAKGFLTFSNFKKVIDELSPYIYHLRLWNWGEPLLNKEIFQMISYAKEKNIFVNLSTNSHFLDKDTSSLIIKSRLDELIVSLDGASEETYQQYRKGGNFKKVIESIQFLVNEKKRLKCANPYIKLQFIIMKSNEHEIQKIKSLSKSLGVDEIVFKTVGIMDYFSKEDIKKYLPKNKKYSRYSVNSNKVISKKEIKNECDFLWDEIVVNWDGSVVPCCFDMNNLFVFGNAFKEKIRDIWNNNKYLAFRKKILTNKKSLALCKDCPGTNKETFVEI
ncbi:MAG: radical SAM protein [Candidatus Nanoarchaeia archaeon]|nr:radical SAM protein [Candidatus Nanoarchaeia archaeon]MDD5358151.1 radical SAM protein [Candidatus Nanoarchaeia archaeon]MDD5589338.1 radical SAM protein [Candidatus Nanoarchaeia archaeon]